MRCFGTAAILLFTASWNPLRASDPWVVYKGADGPGKGKKVVLIGGDEEYRSEETLPQFAKILAKRHGFDCTVLFAVDKKDGTINPNQSDNIPGLQALKDADLAVFFLRFRNLPDEQMKYIVDYVESGKPMIGLRTATHSFNIPNGKTYSKYGWTSKEWDGGFGRQVLGETWINHHGHHGKQSLGCAHVAVAQPPIRRVFLALSACVFVVISLAHGELDVTRSNSVPPKVPQR